MAVVGVPLINGVEYTHADIVCNILGFPIVGITSIKYSDMQATYNVRQYYIESLTVNNTMVGVISGSRQYNYIPIQVFILRTCLIGVISGPT